MRIFYSWIERSVVCNLHWLEIIRRKRFAASYITSASSPEMTDDIRHYSSTSCF